MPKKHRKFADDGWAIWIDGDDTSTIHINDWLNPKGKSYVDIAIHIRGIKSPRGYQTQESPHDCSIIDTMLQKFSFYVMI